MAIKIKDEAKYEVAYIPMETEGMMKQEFEKI